MTSIPIRRSHVCRYCPEGSGIIWNDDDAMRMTDGTWKCTKCIDHDTRKMMIRALGKDHPKNKVAIAEKQKEIDKWNSYANEVNDVNKRMGGSNKILELKKNPYLT
jgi:hypothetical protein